MNVRDLIAQATEQLNSAGVDSARVDAELLLAHVLGVSRTGLITAADPSDQNIAQYNELIGKRAQRIPLQHITGRAAFRYIEVNVGPGVLTPRPETELVVDAALAHLKNFAHADQRPLIIDLCSGSAAMTISLAIESPHSDVVGLEFVDPAFAWGAKNALEHQDAIAAKDSTITLIQADVRGCELDSLSQYQGKASVVVANPPYIPTWAVPRDPEVAKHEPAEALYGGEDGMEFIGAVVDAAAALLLPGGLLVIEHGDTQGEDGEVSVPRAMRSSALFTSVVDHLDLAGRPRFSTGIRV